MKKNYEKPGLLIETFTMTQSIASDCVHWPYEGGIMGEPTLAEKGACGWRIGSIVLWAEETICTDETDVVDNLCYHNPANGIIVFKS